MSESDKPAGASFLSRWSRRKVKAQEAAQVGTVATAEPWPNAPFALPVADDGTAEVRRGNRLPGDPPADENTRTTASTGAVAGAKVPETPRPEPALPDTPQPRQELPAIDSLTHEADFSPFMAREVDPGLRNQAMKKLFTNPHYQFAQMDKLDIYIDDYSQPDPLPLEMLRQMNQAKSLGLFDDEEEDPSDPAIAPDALPDPAGNAAPTSGRVGAGDAADAAPEREVAVEANAEKTDAAGDAAGNVPEKNVGLVGISNADRPA